MVQEPGSESVPQPLRVTALTSPYPVPDPPTSMYCVCLSSVLPTLSLSLHWRGVGFLPVGFFILYKDPVTEFLIDGIFKSSDSERDDYS